METPGTPAISPHPPHPPHDQDQLLRHQNARRWIQAQLTSGVPDTPDLIDLLVAERKRLGITVPGFDSLGKVRTVLLGLSSLLRWAILPRRRDDPWWRSQVQTNVTALIDDQL